MAMGGSNGPAGLSSDINVAPLIDVLLVLLIIFMVIVPVVPKGLDALVPQPSHNSGGDHAIVVSVLKTNGHQMAYKINEEAVRKDELLGRLTEIYANRAEKVMFIKGDDDVNFALVADVIDIGHQAGVDHVGMMTPKDSQI